MKLYLKSIDQNMVGKGYELPKAECKWNEDDIKWDALNAKAMNALVYALSSVELNNVSNCETAEEIWML